jgi:hypothetical protein
MKTQRLCVALIILNVLLVTLQFARGSPNNTDPGGPIVRARVLELVDDQGRVRAELRVLPAQPDLKMPDGTEGFPEAVQLRLLTSRNGPNVKLVTTEDGSGLVLGGEMGYIQLLSRSAEDPFVKIVTKDGRERVVKP